MSTIIDALKKAQKEEAIKKERKADRVVWVATRSQSKWIVPVGVGFCFSIIVLLGFWLFFTDPPTEMPAIETPGRQIVKTQSSPIEQHPVLKGKPVNANLVLSGIMWDEREPIALINASPLKKGESISGVQVISISRDQVQLSAEGETWTLSLE